MRYLKLKDCRSEYSKGRLTNGYTIEPIVIKDGDNFEFSDWLSDLYPSDVCTVAQYEAIAEATISEGRHDVLEYSLSPIDAYTALAFEIALIVDQYGNLTPKDLVSEGAWVDALRRAVLNWYAHAGYVYSSKLHPMYEGSLINFVDAHYGMVWDEMYASGKLGMPAPIGTIPYAGQALIHAWNGDLVLQNNVRPEAYPKFYGFGEGYVDITSKYWVVVDHYNIRHFIPRNNIPDTVQAVTFSGDDADRPEPGWYTITDGGIVVRAYA